MAPRSRIELQIEPSEKKLPCGWCLLPLLRKAIRAMWRRLKALFVVFWKNAVPLSMGVVIAGMVTYSAFLLTQSTAEARGGGFATLATGVALALVAFLTYRLERRSLDLSTTPILGAIWKEAFLSPHEEVGESEKPVSVEFLFWNAGQIPVLIFQPSALLFRDIRAKLGHYEPELVLEGDSSGLGEKCTFPIVLGKGHRCIWRLTMLDKVQFTPRFLHFVGDNKKSLRTWYREVGSEEEGVTRFAFDIQYSGEPPPNLKQKGIQHQYIGFAYKIDKPDDGEE